MELASMLPGFRFLFTAIVLSMSVLILAWRRRPAACRA